MYILEHKSSLGVGPSSYLCLKTVCENCTMQLLDPSLQPQPFLTQSGNRSFVDISVTR